MALTDSISSAHLGHTLHPKDALLEDERRQTKTLAHICDFFQTVNKCQEKNLQKIKLFVKHDLTLHEFLQESVFNVKINKCLGGNV